MADRYPTVVFGRLLTCTVCLAQVDLIEIPKPWIDEATYVCGLCLEPIPEPSRPPLPIGPPQLRSAA